MQTRCKEGRRGVDTVRGRTAHYKDGHFLCYLAPSACFLREMHCGDQFDALRGAGASGPPCLRPAETRKRPLLDVHP